MLRTRSLRCAALPSVRHGPAHHLRRPRRRAPLGVSLLEVRRPYHQPVSLSTRGFDRSLLVFFFFRRAAAGSDSFHFLHFFFFGRQCRNPILGPTRQEYVRQHFPRATFLQHFCATFRKKTREAIGRSAMEVAGSRSRSGATIEARPSSAFCDRRPLFLSLSFSVSITFPNFPVRAGPHRVSPWKLAVVWADIRSTMVHLVCLESIATCESKFQFCQTTCGRRS